jgi:uncharacterized membrane protein YgcG
MTPPPELRIGDAERDATAASLREHYAQGRLTLDELNDRLGVNFAATTQSQLSKLTADLPQLQAPAPPAAVSLARPRRRQGMAAGRAAVLAGLVLVALFLVELIAHRSHEPHTGANIVMIIVGVLVVRAIAGVSMSRRYATRMQTRAAHMQAHADRLQAHAERWQDHAERWQDHAEGWHGSRHHHGHHHGRGGGGGGRGGGGRGGGGGGRGRGGGSDSGDGAW